MVIRSIIGSILFSSKWSDGNEIIKNSKNKRFLFNQKNSPLIKLEYKEGRQFRLVRNHFYYSSNNLFVIPYTPRMLAKILLILLYGFITLFMLIEAYIDGKLTVIFVIALTLVEIILIPITYMPTLLYSRGDKVTIDLDHNKLI